MTADSKPRPATTPDASPRRRKDPDERSGSQVSEAQDPKIAGDQKGDESAANTFEPVVDEAGGVRGRRAPDDLLH